MVKKQLIKTVVAYNDYSDPLFGDKLETAEKNKNRLLRELEVESSFLKKGDTVVMHTCGEADVYDGKLWVCQTDEQKLHPKHDYTVVWLEGFSGAFATEFLQKVRVDETIGAHS